jgi:hypothetical protein
MQNAKPEKLEKSSFSDGGLSNSRRALPPRASPLLCHLTFQRGSLTVSKAARGEMPRAALQLVKKVLYGLF